jgi:hypothetical protein
MPHSIGIGSKKQPEIIPSQPSSQRRPQGVSVLAILLFAIGLFAFIGSLWLWGAGFLFSFPAGTDYVFPIADILVNAPASIVAAVGLWRMRQWGYAAAQFVAGFYTYASVEIFVMVIQDGAPYPLRIILPQLAALLIAAFLVLYRWRIRSRFGFRLENS